MRAIIDRKRYDTEMATEVARIESGHNLSDTEYFTEGLYVTLKYSWFLAGWGNARSPYATVAGSARSSGERVTVLTPGEAVEWLEEHGKVDAIEDYFGALIEDA